MEVTQAELLEVFGLSNPTILKYRRLGMPLLRPAGARGQANYYETVDVYHWLVNRQLDRAGVEEDDDLDGEQELAQLRRSQREKVELQNAQMRTELIPHDEAVRAWSQLATAIRSKILAVPTRMRTRIPDMPKDAQDELKLLLREALDELSRVDPLGDLEGNEDTSAAA